MLLADNLNQLLDILPEFISKPLRTTEMRTQLIEIVLDIGRRPEARFATGTKYLSYKTIVWQDLEYVLKITNLSVRHQVLSDIHHIVRSAH